MQKTYNYCTLFNSKYLSRGLALHKSLIRVGASFRLFILAMDDATANTLRNLRLAHTKVVTLAKFEDSELKVIKQARTFQEYCWTCTPSIIKYCIETFKLPECTYLDADIYFFSDPEILQREFQTKSVLITEHRYHPDYDYSGTSGRFCVQYVSFRNDAAGLEALNWWRNACNVWCFAYYQDGKFGDQMYLNDWPARFKRVHILRHLGGGVAPWNLSSFDVDEIGKKVMIREKKKQSVHQLIFYHFHDFRFDATGNWFHNSGFPGYHIGRDAYRLIYAPYLRTLFSLRQAIGDSGITDMPSLPQTIDGAQFDKMIVPNISNSQDKIFLRKIYRNRGSEYSLTSGLDRKTMEKAFSAIIEGGYNLDRYAFWLFPGNYVYEYMKARDEKPSKVDLFITRLKRSSGFGIFRRIRRRIAKK
ncbi:MAG: hypothetical protein U1F16_04895 [Turneriella sp.]